MDQHEIENQLKARIEISKLCGLTDEEARQSAIDWVKRTHNIDLRQELHLPVTAYRFAKATELAERVGIQGNGTAKGYTFNLMCWALGLVYPIPGGWKASPLGKESGLVRNASTGAIVEFLPEVLTKIAEINAFNLDHAKAMHRAVAGNDA